MKLAYICSDPGVPVFGNKGSSVHVQQMSAAFAQLGAQITLFARRLGGKQPTPSPYVELIRLPKLPPRDDPERERATQAADAVTAARVRDAAPFTLAYERYSLWSHAGLEAAREAGATTVLEVNAPLIEEQARFRTLRDERSALRASRRAFAAADIIVAVSDEVSAYLAHFPQTRGRVIVVPNGVDETRFAAAPGARQATSHPYTLGLVGTLKPWHGVETLIRAFAALNAEINETRLLIVGDGPEREALQHLCNTLGVREQTEFTGAVAPAQVPRLLARMDVGVAPYPALEHFYFSPLKVFEYLASGMPAIASDIGQLKQISSELGGTILCPPGDVHAFHAAFRTLYAHPHRRHTLGVQGRENVLRNHTWKSAASRILNLADVDHAPAGCRT